jgi:cytochrome b561
VSPLELVDDRFEQLAKELRASRPVTPEGLRDRVEALAHVEPEPRREWGFRLPSRRVAVALVAVAILGSFIAAGVTGLGGSTSHSKAVESFGASLGADKTPVTTTEALRSAAAPHGLDANAKTLPPAGGRLQQYDAALTLRVRDSDQLSARTQQAMRLTRSLGGFVASASFDVPGRQGTSTLVLRIPIDRVQQALSAFAGYGTLLAQKISVQDLQQRADAQSSRIAALKRAITALETQLQGTLSQTERDRLEHLLSIERSRLAAQQKRLGATVRRAELARVGVTLVTPTPKASAAPGRFDRTLDDAGSVLARELEILLYALVVVGPLLALGGIAIAVGRTHRRRSDRRLLERT